ncbi:hypothetical protein PR001_g7469 [Phytophthora rubi]|uniref:Uncharacterized protein n=1 Tax=Phytophthora rubi TaxID=129364 RepID=A0A6A3NBZ3_9STRA|nr:hypothetical protein PR001_g7469 [Phytophthora rubi]
MQALTPELATQIAADHPALQSLNLSSNALADVRHLQLLPRSLTQLDLGANRLAALPRELGAWLPNLRLLRLRGNALESLRPLASCARLQTLDAGANRVALLSELRFLQSLAQLRHLALDGNPLTGSAAYRREVLAMLPQLQTLDGREVTAAERLYAKLQLKTQLGSGTAASPAPSPTRLLTPESLQRNAGKQEGAAAAAVLSVEVDGGVSRREVDGRGEWRRQRSGDFRDDRVELHVSDTAESQPSPLTLASTRGPAPSASVLHVSTPERSEMYRPARRWEHVESGSTRQNESNVTRDSGGDFASKPRRDHAAASPSVETREVLLNSRVDALEAIMAVQDKTMKNALARFGQQNAGSQLSLSVKNGNGVAPTVETAAEVYTQLLTAWRKKCVALMVQARSSELAHEALSSEHRQQEAQICEELERCEEKLEMWQQRAADFEAQRDLEVVAARQAEDRRVQANVKAVQAVRSLALERENVQHLSQTVVRFTGGLVRDKMEQLCSSSSRLEALERRLLFAKERIELAATLVKHREVRLRNSEAAMEAERRVWGHRLEQMRNMALQSEGSKKENNGDSADVAASSRDNGKMLRPATETALRALFHRLDAYDTGLVHSQTLLQALRRGDPGVLNAVGGPKKLSKLVSHVETAIRKLSLGGGATITLTWGEFLLFFIPESSVSLSGALQDAGNTDNGVKATIDQVDGPCALCTAVRTNNLPSLPLSFPVRRSDPLDKMEGEPKSPKQRKERKGLEVLSHAELVQQNAALLADRERLRRIVARDAHDLRDQLRGIRREWEVKTGELVYQKDRLQRELNERDVGLINAQKRCKEAEAARDKAFLEIQRLRDQLSSQEQDFEQHRTKLEAEHADRLQHEQEIWQTEIQDARLAHSLLQSDHSKQQVRIRQLERDLSRQKEALLAHETERVASLEDKVRRRDGELTRLRRERNTILSSLREQEQKLAVATKPVEPTPTESTATQTEDAPPTKQRTVASQTTAKSTTATGDLKRGREEGRGGRMSINEISAPNSLHKQHEVEDVKPPPRSAGAAMARITPEDVNMRLQKLQSLTESLLAD